MRFTIRKKLIFTFFAVAVFMLLLAAFSIFNLNRLNADSRTILNDYQSALSDTSEIVSNILFHSLKIEQYVATGNPAHLRTVKDLQAKVDAYLTDIHKKQMDPQEKNLVRKIEEAYQTYLALSVELLDFYNKNTRDREIIAGKQMRILALLENTLLADSSSLYGLKKLKTTSLIEGNHRLYRTYLLITLLSGLFFSLVVLLMGVSIIHSISTPINKLVATTRQLASGNLNARPSMRGTDEIGVLAEAFSTMADQIQELVETLENKVVERTHELSEEQNFVSAVLDTANALVVVFDPDGRIIRFNKACQTITGYAFSEVKNKPVWELLMLPESAEDYKTVLEKFKKDRVLDSYESYWITKKGALRLIAWSHTALVDPQGLITHIVATGIDITERRRMEQELFKIGKLESTGVLAGGIAHDFNNLLTSIHGEIEMAQMNLKKGTKGYYNLMQAIGSCNRARDLIWQFITISKGGAPIKKEGALLPLIKEVCNPILSGSNIQCQVSQTESLWVVAFDRSQIEQVIHNLVINAKEAMPEGGTIRIWLENVSIHGELPDYILEQGEYVRIVIQDEGRGIPEKHLPLLFDPYFSTKERGSQKGMGLGLTTAYAIIKKHGGHIDLTSKVGIGTTFYIYLPAVRPEK